VPLSGSYLGGVRGALGVGEAGRILGGAQEGGEVAVRELVAQEHGVVALVAVVRVIQLQVAGAGWSQHCLSLH
jgi:hypothetical protein